MCNKKLRKSYPHLTPVSEFSGRGQCVTANIRKHLKKLFPSVKFSVTNKHSIRVSWIDGPTESKVKIELSIFDYSDFDAITDYHGIESTDFTNMFGGEAFIFVSQELSNEYKEKILDRLNASRQGGNSITLENMNNHDFSNYFDGEDNCDSYSRHFWDDFREVCSAVSGGYLTEREIQKNITLENFDCGIIHQALKVEIPLFYLVSYIYYSQPELSSANQENITFQKEKIEKLIIDAQCKIDGVETPDEKEEREYNEHCTRAQVKIDNIKPVQVELLDKHIDIQVKMPALNKNCTLHENQKEIDKDSYTQTYELYKIVTLSENDYKLAGDNLMNEIACIWGNEYPQNFYNSDDEAHWPVIKVFCEGDKNQNFIVDTQGFKYARYVGQVVGSQNQVQVQETKEVNQPTIDKNNSKEKEQEQTGNQFASVADFMAFKNKNTINNAKKVYM